jgi:hypothetical protein
MIARLMKRRSFMNTVEIAQKLDKVQFTNSNLFYWFLEGPSEIYQHKL